MKVVIAEKPSVAREIAAVLGAKGRKEGYLEGAGYQVTWAFGHLVELCPPDTYGWKQWQKETLPMLPETFCLQPAHRYDPASKESKVDPGVVKQLGIIKQLFSTAAEIIVATDAGREGELIFRYIYQHLQIRKPVRRLWISSLTNTAIREGFNQLKPASSFDNLYFSARSRSEADWLVGMNATRALSIGAGKGTFSIGRVQTPTLAIICRRFIENRDFKPETYFILRIELDKGGQAFFAYSTENFTSKDEAEARLQKVLSADHAEVTDVQQKEKTEPAPLLYDLTSLQQDANRQYALSADDTLKAAQSLYESKYITYPRTGSRYIGADVFANVPSLIGKAESHPQYGTAATALKGKKLNKRSVDDSKVTDHHALLITENTPGSLGRNEQLIYALVLSRMLEAFSASCIKDVTTVKLNAGGEPFKASGSVIRQMGWRSVKEEREDKPEQEENADSMLPPLTKGEKVNRRDAQVLEKQTKPKPIHTEATLLKGMETCGKEIEDETLREAMKEGGLGTPATRAAIIEVLLTRSYIERQKKNLVPTAKGLAVFELIKDKTVASPELTGRWEKKLSEIARGNADAKLFMQEITAYTRETTLELLQIGKALAGTEVRAPGKNDLVCPKCRKGALRKGEKNWWCTEYKNGCDFKIWLEVAGKKLTDANVKQLAKKGKTAMIKGFTSKGGKKFDCPLKLDEHHKVTFSF